MLSARGQNGESYQNEPYAPHDKAELSDFDDDDSPLVGLPLRQNRPSSLSLANTLCLIVFTISITAVGFGMGVIGTMAIYGKSKCFRRSLANPNLGSFETGFATEFDAATSAIEIQKVQFTSGLEWDEDGNLYRTFNHDEKPYVGPPSPELDQTWEELVRGTFIAVTPEEADNIGGMIYYNSALGFHRAGVSVLHTLHCLNVIRQALYPSYYPSKNPNHQRLHVDHCIDHIRLYIQCHGDLTPLPEQWAESANRTNPGFHVVHTCRNFDRIRRWATERHAEVKALIKSKQQSP